MRILPFIFLVLLSSLLPAQDIQWASEVKDFSSEFEYEAPVQYSASQILGPPSVRSDFGASPCAWTPGRPDNAQREFIVVGFRNPQTVQQILINETRGKGAIDAIDLIDTQGKPHAVSKAAWAASRPDDEILRILIAPTPYQVQALRLTLATDRVSGFNQIDAIGIADHRNSYSIPIRVASGTDAIAPPRNLGPVINSKAEELCPVISPDGKTLYFVRQNHPQNYGPDTQDIWYAELDEDAQPSAPKNMGRPLNNDNHSALTSITPDGQTALLLNIYRPNGDMAVGISQSRRTSEGWGQPDSLAIEDFQNQARSGEYVLSSTGRVLIMAVQRSNGYGGKDLFISFKQSDGSWTRPRSLGPVLNTADNEAAPFLAADDRTLYFSTSGRPGFGSKDMFVTRRTDDSWLEWSEPENLGPVLNTPGWDAYYSVPASGRYVYFVSYADGGYGKGDIYRAELPATLRPQPVVLVTGTVTNQKTGTPLGTEISYTSLTTGQSIGEAHSDPTTGAYRIVLPAGDLFGFSASKEYFLPDSSSLDLRELNSYEEVRQDLALVPIERGASIVLNNLYFDFGKHDLRPESDVELEQMAAVLKQYPRMKVEIAGHTDNVGTEADNLQLSDRRAQAVVAFLERQGISRSRLVPKGYGEGQPTVANSTAELRQKNRRVEFRIIAL